jgi:hypothetical protein
VEPFRSGAIQSNFYRDGYVEITVAAAVNDPHPSSANFLKYFVPGKERRSYCRGQAAICCVGGCFLHARFPAIQDEDMFERVMLSRYARQKVLIISRRFAPSDLINVDGVVQHSASPGPLAPNVSPHGEGPPPRAPVFSPRPKTLTRKRIFDANA